MPFNYVFSLVVMVTLLSYWLILFFWKSISNLFRDADEAAVAIVTMLTPMAIAIAPLIALAPPE